MSKTNRLNVILALIAALAVGMFLLGYSRGAQMARQEQDKRWCMALQGAGVDMRGFPPCE